MEYNIKYKRDQEIYIQLLNKIIKTYVVKIRIIEGEPYVNGNDMTKNDGIQISYLVVVKQTKQPDGNGRSTSYDWFDQKDVFVSENEALSKIN